MKRVLFTFVITLALVFTLSACGKGDQQEETAKPEPPAGASRKAPAVDKRHDLSTLKPIDFVSAEEVAAAVGGKAETQGGQTSGPREAVYLIDFPSGATVRYYLRFESAEWDRDFLQSQQKKNALEKVPGLWDEAYFFPKTTLYVIRRADMELKIWGLGGTVYQNRGDKEALIAIAKLAISKLK